MKCIIMDQNENPASPLTKNSPFTHDREESLGFPFYSAENSLQTCDHSEDGTQGSSDSITNKNVVDDTTGYFISDDPFCSLSFEIEELLEQKSNPVLLQQKLENMQLAIRFHEVTAWDRESEIDLLQSTTDSLQLELDSETDIALKLAACLAAHDDDDEFLEDLDLKDTSIDEPIDF